MSDAPTEQDGPRMSLSDHLEELRRRLFYALAGLVAAAIAALACGDRLVQLFRHPYEKALAEVGREPDLTVLSLWTGFTTYLKISLTAGFVLAAPWIFYQLWKFIGAGLYPRERRAIMIAAPFSAALFMTGGAFFVFIVAVPIMRFFIHFTDWLGLTLMITFDSHVTFMTSMVLVFGLAFQTPLLVLILAKIGIISLATLHAYRRHVIVVILILAAMLTPPDVISQISLGIPMWMLYELGVVLVWLLVPKARKNARK